MTDSVVLLSLKPRFASAIIDGTKTVEVRRERAHISPGSLGLVYAASPVRALIGAVRIGVVETWRPSTVWRKWGKQTGLLHNEFAAYLADAHLATAIELVGIAKFSRPIELAELCVRSSGFRPPQSYRFLSDLELHAMLNGEAQLLRSLKVR